MWTWHMKTSPKIPASLFPDDDEAKGLIFSLFDLASAGHMPFGIPQYIQCILHGLISVLLCVPFIFADGERCQFGGSA